MGPLLHSVQTGGCRPLGAWRVRAGWSGLDKRWRWVTSARPAEGGGCGSGLWLTCWGLGRPGLPLPSAGQADP